MRKYLFLFICLFYAIPVFAGIYENAVAGNKDVLLYLYTKDCMMCKRFDPEFEHLKKVYPNLNFISVDAETAYGARLMWKFRGRYVPYLVLTKHKSSKSAVIHPSCSLDEMCMERVLKEFKG